MSNCRVEKETAQHDIAVMESTANYDNGITLIKCIECFDRKPKDEMRHVFDWIDEGCCDDCSMDEDVKIDWGF